MLNIIQFNQWRGGIGFRLLNATFDDISIISWCWFRQKTQCPEKTTDLW